MADPAEEKADDKFSLPIPSSHDSDTEIVLRREVLDSCLSPNEESSGESVDKFDHGLENWRWKPNTPDPVEKTFDLDRDSHIESVEDKCNANRDEKCAGNEGVRRPDSAALDSGKITENEPLRKTLESHVDKSPEMEFRHRYSNNDRLSSREEETRVIHGSEHVSELVEPEVKSYKKADEDPSIREEASEQRLQEDHDMKSKRVQGLQNCDHIACSYYLAGYFVFGIRILLDLFAECSATFNNLSTSWLIWLISFICYQPQSS